VNSPPSHKEPEADAVARRLRDTAVEYENGWERMREEIRSLEQRAALQHEDIAKAGEVSLIAAWHRDARLAHLARTGLHIEQLMHRLERTLEETETTKAAAYAFDRAYQSIASELAPQVPDASPLFDEAYRSNFLGAAYAAFSSLPGVTGIPIPPDLASSYEQRPAHERRELQLPASPELQEVQSSSDDASAEAIQEITVRYARNIARLAPMRDRLRSITQKQKAELEAIEAQTAEISHEVDQLRRQARADSTYISYLRTLILDAERQLIHEKAVGHQNREAYNRLRDDLLQVKRRDVSRFVEKQARTRLLAGFRREYGLMPKTRDILARPKAAPSKGAAARRLAAHMAAGGAAPASQLNAG